MTKEEIIELAKQAGWEYAHGESGFEPLWAFAKLVAQHERERICEIVKEGLWDGAGIRHHLEQGDKND